MSKRRFYEIWNQFSIFLVISGISSDCHFFLCRYFLEVKEFVNNIESWLQQGLTDYNTSLKNQKLNGMLKYVFFFYLVYLVYMSNFISVIIP